jgi:hypothetical protein
MRYHWGLGVGHLHAHQAASTSCHGAEVPDGIEDNLCHDSEPVEGMCNNMQAEEQPEDSDMYDDTENPELGLEDHHLSEEGWQGVETDVSEDESRGVFDLEDTEGEDST